MFAWGIDLVMKVYEPKIGARKRDLFRGLGGRVLEIGPGTGINLKYFPKDIQWIGVEPNSHMVPYLEREAKRHGISTELVIGSAEEMPLESASVDFVVGTLVLCSVPDPVRALREVRRVLKPGGSYLFVEHVAAEPGTGSAILQRAIKPLWKCCADGCNVDRRTWETIERAGFSSVALESFRLPMPVVSPHIMGRAIV